MCTAHDLKNPEQLEALQNPREKRPYRPFSPSFRLRSYLDEPWKIRSMTGLIAVTAPGLSGFDPKLARARTKLESRRA
ncbi:uncharacterized protein LAJ45_11632 [Morchella importuna]|uniref:uncharacterized protein n=1 Tax=Morchella importuna TaxID=1174673 RepID=UPI001E8DF3C0|nr:uncharacterized protein LAJ45_11632 [Morchella importuna]KAH8144386.1 hypothetical protein LAJ45_11632 [Morchella importuna]